MNYIVMRGGEKIAVKESMDDALDVIDGMVGFDKAEGMDVTRYMVMIVRKKEEKK